MKKSTLCLLLGALTCAPGFAGLTSSWPVWLMWGGVCLAVLLLVAAGFFTALETTAE